MVGSPSFPGCLVIVLVLKFFLIVHGEPAQPLIEFNANGNPSYKLNRNLLADIANLPFPIRVISMIGNARDGQSTLLNIVHHVWNGTDHSNVEEVFQTGDSLSLVTRGVWARIIRHEEGSTILLDVQAPDSSDGSQAAHFNMFSGIISSGITMLAREYIQDSNLGQLFYMARLGELFFPEVSTNRFPKLRVVMRGGLDAPGGLPFEDYIRDSIAGNFNQKRIQDKRKIIARFFKRNEIAVSQVPHVTDRRIFKNPKQLAKSDYLSAVRKLAKELKEFPVKRTLKGSPMDGSALAELIEGVTETINANTWPDFANIYDMIETNICERREAKIASVLFPLTADETEARKQHILDAYRKECSLEGKITSMGEKLQQIIQAKKTLEDLNMTVVECEKKQVEDNQRKSKEEEEFQRLIAEKDKEIARERRTCQESEVEVQNLTEKLKVCVIWSRSEWERGWKDAFKSFLYGDIPGGAEILYNGRQERPRKEDVKDDSKIQRMFDDFTKKLEEHQKQVLDTIQARHALREWSELFIKVLSICSSIMGIMLQIRTLFQ